MKQSQFELRSAYMPLRGTMSWPISIASVTLEAPSVPPDSVTGLDRIGAAVEVCALATTNWLGPWKGSAVVDGAGEVAPEGLPGACAAGQCGAGHRDYGGRLGERQRVAAGTRKGTVVANWLAVKVSTEPDRP